MSNPQNLQQRHALAQMVADMAALQKQQAAVHRRHLEQLQAQAERQMRVLQNLLAQFEAAANPLHLGGLELSPEEHRLRFRNCCIAEEDPFGFAQRLLYEAERWLQPGPTQREARLLEAVVLEQFVKGLQGETAEWVKRHKPPNVEVAVKLAEDHLLGRSEIVAGSLPGEELAVDAVPGSPGAAQTLGQESWQCGQLGHFYREGPLMQVLRVATPVGTYSLTDLPPVSDKEAQVLSDVKEIMRCVSEGLHGPDKLSAFLRDKIEDLETDKRHLVGVFGRTGAGKSSLINAIINKKGLLPSGSVSACTSVMIKVEATSGSMYEAHIEFITKEDWENEVQSLKQVLEDDDDHMDDGGNDDFLDPAGKLSALYGEEWKERSTHSLMDNNYFRDIPEFLKAQMKILQSDSAEGLSEEIVKYTRSDSNKREEEVKRWYWPLVKCVTFKVPDNDFLDHVTLVDLPGNGDCRSSDKIWIEFVASCSTVWIVTEMTRAASEKEAWDILEGASRLLENGGECQQIHFICTKSDNEKPDDL